MSKIPKYFLIPDTNILWNKEKDVVVNQNFEDFWTEYSSAYPLQLIIPDVVKGELLFQHSESALKKVSNIKSIMSGLNDNIDSSHSFSLTPEQINKKVEKRFNSWLKRCHGSIEDLPLDKIDWKKLIHSAINHHPPFKKEDNKKEQSRGDDGGFKDSLILETIYEFAQDNPKEKIAFI